MKKYAFIIILAFLILFSSCSGYVNGKNDYDVGKTVNSSVLESIKNNAPDDDSNASDVTLELNESTVLFWTRNGSKLHLSSSCRYLSKTAPENICSGTYSDANGEGLSEVCSACMKSGGLSDVTLTTSDSANVTAETPTDTSGSTPDTTASLDKNAVLYWTVSGSKYHIYRDCRSLSGSDEANIRSGNADEAKNNGKNGVCSFCLKKTGLEENELPWNRSNDSAD